MKKFMFLLMLFFGVAIHAQERNERTVSTVIEFVINTDTIIQNENYWDYLNRIIPEITKNSESVESVLLIGSASPEGNHNKNVVLSNKRADKIYSYISNLVSKDRIIKNNNYGLFLYKTGLDESDYQKLRATYVEVHFKEPDIPKVDTVYVTNEVCVTDTIRITDTLHVTDTVVTNPVKEEKLVLSLYNDFVSDMFINHNIGLELFFAKMSLFVDGTFNYRKDLNVWHTGLRKYFNWDYNKVFIEIYGRTGYFTSGNLYGGGLGVGYKFDLGSRWKVYPLIRIGYDRRYYGSESEGDVSFGEYVPGTKSADSPVIENDFKPASKYITDYFGPTYIGIVFQRSFYIKSK